MSVHVKRAEFVAFFNQAATIDEVCERFGIDRRSARIRARRARKLGEELKLLPTIRRSSNTRLRAIWTGMKQRCNNQKNSAYRYYGGRGIVLCEEWRLDFSAFASWALANGYTEELTIDRRDTNGNYEPGNCRWATMGQQAMNRGKERGSRHSQFKGVHHRKPHGLWYAQLQYKGKQYVKGPFKTEVEAAIAYDQLAKRHFGEYAYFNFPELITSE